jgi:AraC-like DNA-binding protein
MMKNLRLYSTTLPILLCSLLISLNGFSVTKIDSLEEGVSLAGNWKINWGDDERFSSVYFDDSSWDSIQMPGSFMNYLRRQGRRGSGIVWLRKTVFFAQGMRRERVGLILGRIGNADMTYFNGYKIGEMGRFSPHEFSMWNLSRHYRIQHKLIRYGEKNVIAVRISYNLYGEMLGEILITNEKRWKEDRVDQILFRVGICYAIMAIGMMLLVIFLIFFIKKPQFQEYFYYSLQMFFGFFIVLELCSYWQIYGSTFNRFKLYGFCWIAVVATHPIFLHRFYNFKRKKIEIVLWGYFALMGTFWLIFTDQTLLYRHGIILVVLSTCVGLYNLNCHVTAFVTREPYLKLFSVLGIVVILGGIHDGIVHYTRLGGTRIEIFGYVFQHFVFHYGAAFLFLGIALDLVNRFTNLIVEVEDLNASLENFVIINAMLKEKLDKTLQKKSSSAISSKTETKIKKVMAYIEKNFHSGLSREELADSVNVHPDNLGRNFKTYTGKKISDYIYELRINEAARRLEETDETIINIAFSVGFESLRTFNRVFPKFKETTPEKYRAAFLKKGSDSSNS